MRRRREGTKPPKCEQVRFLKLGEKREEPWLHRKDINKGDLLRGLGVLMDKNKKAIREPVCGGCGKKRRCREKKGEIRPVGGKGDWRQGDHRVPRPCGKDWEFQDEAVSWKKVQDGKGNVCRNEKKKTPRNQKEGKIKIF